MAEPGFPQAEYAKYKKILWMFRAKKIDRKVEDRLYDGDIRLHKTSG